MEAYYCLVEGRRGFKREHPTLALAYAEAKRLYGEFGYRRKVRVLQVVGEIEPTKPPPRELGGK
jgi:hypothetical protein